MNLLTGTLDIVDKGHSPVTNQQGAEKYFPKKLIVV